MRGYFCIISGLLITFNMRKTDCHCIPNWIYHIQGTKKCIFACVLHYASTSVSYISFIV